MDDKRELNLDEMEDASGGSNPSYDYSQYGRSLIEKYGGKVGRTDLFKDVLPKATEEERQRLDELDQAKMRYVKSFRKQ